MRASVDAGGRSRSQYSQFGRSSSAIDALLHSVGNAQTLACLLDWHLDVGPTVPLGRSTRSISLVIIRCLLELVGLYQVVVDPELRMFLRDDIGNALHRSERLVLAGVHLRHAAIVPRLTRADWTAAGHRA